MTSCEKDRTKKGQVLQAKELLFIPKEFVLFAQELGERKK